MPSLLALRVIAPKPQPEYRTIHRLLGIKRATATTTVAPLDALFDKTQRGLGLLWPLNILLVVGSFLAAIVVALGPTRNGIFRSFSGAVPSDQLQGWLDAAYQSWWASIDHPMGFVAFIFLMALGFYLVLIQSAVGLIAVWMLLGLSAVADLSLDWLDRDGNYGWQTVSVAYRTVVGSLSLHGSALSVALLAMGTENFGWASTAIAVWVIMLPSFAIVPRYALRGISKRAQEVRISALVSSAQSSGLLAEEELRERIRAIRKAAAHPLRITRGELPIFFIAVLLPIILTGVQVYFSVKYG
jgi:hypothetical protein